jgi:Tfp pilus tip-associated adhesin PilY1
LGTVYYGGSCQGSCKGETCAAIPATNYCNGPSSGTPGSNSTWVGDYTIDNTPYTNVTKSSTGATGNCSDKSDATQNCKTRAGVGVTSCTYSTRSLGSGGTGNTYACPNQTGTYGSTSVNFRYPVYNQRSTDSNLIHECIADNGKDPDSNVKTYNPYANATTQKNSFLVKAKRNFDQSPNQSVATSPTDGANPGSVGINFTASYASLSSSAITEDSNKKINIYSSNYLNWKFGAKACRNSSGALITSGSLTGAVCNPIGRKTRLQITKDALNDLIDTTDGVRFGLTVFNGLPSDLTLQSTKGSEGGKIMFPVLPMGADAADPNFKNRVELKRIINWLEADAATPLTETIHEVYRYFRGEQPYFGTSTALSTNCGASCLNSAAGGTGINGVTTGNAAESTSTSTFPTYTLKQLTINGANYVSPMAAQANAKCHKNHIVLVSDGGPDRDTSTDTLISTLVGGVELKDGGSPSLPYGSKDITAGSYIWLDELTNYMSLNDMYTAIAENQTISTYTIGFAGGNTPVLKNAATSSGGSNYLAEDSAALSAALAATIAAIRDWNPTIASPSVPLNALNRTESSDDAYLAFFGPKGGKAWDGTLKKYKISTKNTDCGNDLDGNQILMCLTGQASFSLGVKNINEFEKDKVTGKVSGKIREAAVGIWGDLGDPDGGKPNKGGSGYILSSTAGLTPDTRKVYTYLLPGSASNTLSNSTNAFSENNSLITKTRLGNAGMSDAKRASILNFTRGGDLANASCSDADSATACTTWRSWGHGDILHSKPAILSYEIIDDPDLTVDSNGDGIVDNDKTTRDYVFYMSNDGHLHAVDTTTGIEKWAFVPSEALGQLQAIMDNEVGEHITASDGSPVIYVEDTDKDGKITTADKAWLFFGLRRGGRAMYAFDIADKDNPKLMWKIDSTQAEFSELGETWSIPDVAKLRASADPVLVFGAGYDPKANDMITVSKLTNASGVASAETSVEHGYNSGESVTISGAPEAGYNLTTTITVTGTKTFTYPIAGSPVSPSQGKNFDIKVISNTLATMGRGVYFVNARTGALVKSFTGSAGAGSNTQVGGMIYSIPSEATALNADIDSAGYADRLYMGDLGGNVWRFDIDDANVSLWNAIRFADLSGATTPKRKVFFPPAVVKQEYLGQRFDAVYVGTGDVENPLRKDTTDYMFVVKDTETGISSAQSSVISFNTTDFYDVTDNLIQQGDSDQKTAAATAIKNAKGWFMRLEYSGKASVGVGEKVTSPPSVFFNVLRFNTFSPDASSGNSCLPDGTPSSYAISALDGSAPYDVDRNLTLTKSDRRDNAFESRGYTSPGVIVIRDGKVWLLNVSDGVSKATQIGTAGVAQRAYWFQEPER